MFFLYKFVVSLFIYHFFFFIFFDMIFLIWYSCFAII
jgi:hypothetical protein